MRGFIMLLIVSISLPLLAEPADDNGYFYVAISHCLKRASGSGADVTPQCDSLFRSITPSVDAAANAKAASQANPCSGYSAEFGTEYVPVFVGKRSGACVSNEVMDELMKATAPYSRNR